jgi:hypothetical protein
MFFKYVVLYLLPGGQVPPQFPNLMEQLKICLSRFRFMLVAGWLEHECYLRALSSRSAKIILASPWALSLSKPQEKVTLLPLQFLILTTRYQPE